MIRKDELKHGDKVYYQPDFMKEHGVSENGIVKRIKDECDDAVWVVYKCNNDWENYADYTGVKTDLSDLYHGWR